MVIEINCQGIKQLRLDNAMTQNDLALLLGVSVRTISGWETGDRPPRFGYEALKKDYDEVLGKGHGLLKQLKRDQLTNVTKTEGVDEMDLVYKMKYEESLLDIIKLHKEISALKDELLKKPTPSSKEKKA